MHQEVQRGMETRSTAKGFAWQSTLAQYHHHHEEQDEDLHNDEVKQILPQYVETLLQIKDLE